MRRVSLLDDYQRRLNRARTDAAKHLSEGAKLSGDLSRRSQQLSRTKSASSQQSLIRQIQTLEKRRAAAQTKQAKSATEAARLERRVIALTRYAQRRAASPPPPPEVVTVAKAIAADPIPREHDVYLCYASPDVAVAKSLNDELVERGLDVWFDKSSLALGESQTRQMDQGIARSRVGVLLVTPAFLTGRRWTEREWTALVSVDKRVIPVISGASFEALSSYSPMLGQLHGLSIDDLGMTEVADLISESLDR
jgi:hypothetical protein